jgi:hypothetical protein
MTVKRWCTFLTVLAVLVLCFSASVALAAGEHETPGTGWAVTSTTYPSHLFPNGGTGAIGLEVYNVGAKSSTGTVTVTDTLPDGVVATEAGDVQSSSTEKIGEANLWECTGNAPGEALPRTVGKFERPATIVTCVNNKEALPTLPIPTVADSSLSEEDAGAIEHLAVVVKVTATQSATLVNSVTVTGGYAAGAASATGTVTVEPAPASALGVQQVDGWFSNADGSRDTQAGSHPYEAFFSFDLNTTRQEPTRPRSHFIPAEGSPRNITTQLAPGLVGNPTAVPQCTREQFDEEECGASTQIGFDVAELIGPFSGDEIVPNHAPFPVYNLVPPPGMPAEFGFNLLGYQVFIEAGVRSGGDYGITAHADDLPDTSNGIKVLGNRLVLWGEPSDPSHDAQRVSLVGGINGPCTTGCSSGAARVPFFTLPTGCEGPQPTGISVSTWETGAFADESFLSHDATGTPVGTTGCDHLDFGPALSVAPDTGSADTPAGVTVDVNSPQEGLTTPGALAPSDIKDTTVTLPQGFVINPGQAAGLQACKEGDVPGGDDLPLPGENGEEERFAGPADCPKASKVGTVKAKTPLLNEELEGEVYVLQSEPPHLKLLAAFTAAGVNVKLVLDAELSERTGQIATRVENVPELPVTNFRLSFSGGAQAALDTPTQCGTYDTTSDFTPWATPAVQDAFPSSAFAITSGTGASVCPSGALPFTPSLTAGSTTDQAGGFTDFSLLLQKSDEQKRTEKLQFEFPPGFGALLSKVALCPEPQANSGECTDASKIGYVTVASGPGPYPLVIPQPDDPESPMYLTGPYNGRSACTVGEPECAPFGLSIVTHVIAGPFNLGTIITRARVEVDPRTAQILITTNPLPQVVAGVPTDLRLINAIADREGFMYTPTNCSPFTFAGTAWGTSPPGGGEPGVTAPISSPFRVGSCRSLGFSPSFAANSSGKTSKKYGASLSATLSYPGNTPTPGQATSEANIHTVKVELPKQLPSRLTTLQKACTAAQFNLNPAGCPSASIVGTALVHTPVLPVPLTGPAYFVSHGGEAFPALVIVLQGYGLSVIVEATTFISKAGVTSLTFKTAPDAPFSSFTLTSPQGPYSALAANGNLCTSKLTMPTELIAQNGAVLHLTTNVAATGCPKSLTRPQKLAAALKACHKDRKKAKREACEKQARKKYGPVKATKKANKKK